MSVYFVSWSILAKGAITVSNILGLVYICFLGIIHNLRNIFASYLESAEIRIIHTLIW